MDETTALKELVKSIYNELKHIELYDLTQAECNIQAKIKDAAPAIGISIE